jgi:hypothetical protein
MMSGGRPRDRTAVGTSINANKINQLACSVTLGTG